MSAEPIELADLLAPYWSTRRTADALGLAEEELAAVREEGRVLGLKAADSDTYFYPIWTFVRTGAEVVVKPGVALVLHALRGLDGWTIGVFLRLPATELDEQTPEEWIDRRRDTEALADYANLFAAEIRRR